MYERREGEKNKGQKMDGRSRKTEEGSHTKKGLKELSGRTRSQKEVERIRNREKEEM